MTKLPDFAILDFSGGVRTDKSDLQKARNEVVKVNNLDLNKGKVTKRLGGFQYGDTQTNRIDNCLLWQKQDAGSPGTRLIVNNQDGSAADFVQIRGQTSLNGAVALGDGTITVINADLFASSGVIEIEGDLITYSGKTGFTFTGCTGITSTHADKNSVEQATVITNTVVDGRAGVYYAVLNNLLFITGTSDAATYDGTTISAVTGEPNGGMFATTYRQKVHVCGTGTAQIRTYYSANGDATTWDTTNDWFDTEDKSGDSITGYKVSRSDELLIFKINTFFAYDEVNLKQRSTEVGAYSHRVIEEIDGNIYTFCPAGVYVTNGFTTKKISEPIKEYLKDFIPTYLQTGNYTIADNCFATSYDKKYLLYIKDTSSYDSLSDVVLVYDTELKNWTVWSGFTNLTMLKGLKWYNQANNLQRKEALFTGRSDGKLFKMFSKTHRDATSAFVLQFPTDGDIHKDFISDTGTDINGTLTTKSYAMGSPQKLKKFGGLRVLAKVAGWNVSYRLETDKGLSDWKPLGKFQKINQRINFPLNTQGYRIQFRISTLSNVHSPELNGLIVEDINV